MKRFVTILILSLLTACTEKFDDYTIDDFAKPAKTNTPISEIRELYKVHGITTFTREYVVTGVVVANDLSGNFYRTFIIADSTGAVEIKAGTYDLHTIYPIGKRLSVRLKGLTVGSENSMMQLGLKSDRSSGYETNYIGNQSYIDKYIDRLGVMEIVKGKHITIPTLSDAMVGMLVTIDSLTINYGVSDKWADSAYPKDIIAKRNQNDSIYIYTSPYSDFAQKQTPTSMVNATGIVMKLGKKYRIKLRDINDIQIVK